MPTDIRYIKNGEALNEDVIARPMEDIEANLTEIFKAGIPKWFSGTTYEANSYARVGDDVYVAKRQNLNKSPLNNPNDWVLHEGNRQATASDRGTVTISDSTTSNSTITAASSKAAKTLQDDVNTRAYKATTINTGDGLNGGGNLGSNRTFSVDSSVLRDYHLQTGDYDGVDGRILTVGAFGLGSNTQYIGNASVTNNSLKTGFYGYDTTNGSSGGPSSVERGSLIHQRRSTGGGETQTLVTERASNSNELGIWFRYRTNGSWSDWEKHFHTGNMGAGSGLDADKLDGQHGSFYQNASNLNSGIVPRARLSGTYDIVTTGNADTATNADKLDGQHGSFYQNASNLNAGTIPYQRLPYASYSTRGSVEEATDDEARSGANSKFMDARAVHIAFNQYGLGSVAPVYNDFDSTPERTMFISGAGSNDTTTGANPLAYHPVIQLYRNSSGRIAQLGATSEGIYSRSSTSGTWDSWVKHWSDANHGAGSGLDADKLDGQHGSFYQNANNLASGTVPRARLSGTYDVSITGNANTLDGLNSTQFVRSDVDDIIKGKILLGGDGHYNNQNPSIALALGDADTGLSWIEDGNFQIHANGQVVVDITREEFDVLKPLKQNGNQVWHTGNDGAGSGLDADKLDGVQLGTYTSVKDGDNVVATALLASRFSNYWRLINEGSYYPSSSGFDLDTAEVGFYGLVGSGVTGTPDAYGGDGGFWWVTTQKTFDNNDSAVTQMAVSYRKSTPLTAHRSVLNVDSDGNRQWSDWAIGWNNLNHGSGSGLDADKLDGLHASQFLRSDTSTTFQGSGGGVRLTSAADRGYIQALDGNGDNGELWLTGKNAASAQRIEMRADTVTINDAKVWHSGNDGAGSGLDADKLHGKDDNFFRNASNLNAGVVSNARLPYATSSESGVVKFSGFSSVIDGTSDGIAVTPLRLQQKLTSYGLGSDGVYQSNFDNVPYANMFLEGAGSGDETPSSNPLKYYPALNMSRSNSSRRTQMGSTSTNVWSRISDGSDWSDWVKHWSDADMGAGSGLDADLLDGQEGSFFRNASNLNAGTISRARLPEASTTDIGAVERATDSEALNGANDKIPDTLQVRKAFQQYGLGGFISTAPDEPEWDEAPYSGFYPVGSATLKGPSGDGYSRQSSGSTMYSSIWDNGNWSKILIDGRGGSFSTSPEIYVKVSNFGNVKKAVKLWHDGNDGAGSGLDADTLHGKDDDFFRNASNLNAGIISSARLSGTYGINISGNADTATDASNSDKLDGISSSGFVRRDSGEAYNLHIGKYLSFHDYDDGIGADSGVRFYVRNGKIAINQMDDTTGSVGMSFSGNDVWHEGNDGSGSGLDADLLDGQHGSYYRNAGNLNAGTVPSSRMSGTYDISITGNAGKVDGLNASQLVRSDVDDVINGKVLLRGDGSHGGSSPSIALALGDPDTGFKWISDGRFQIYANDQAVADITSGDFDALKTLKQNGHPVWHDGANTWSKGNSGYVKLPNGLILQWKRETRQGPYGSGSEDPGDDLNHRHRTVGWNTSFPISFPSKCVYASVSTQGDVAGDAESTELVGTIGSLGRGSLYYKLTRIYGDNTDGEDVYVTIFAMGY